MIRKSLSAPKVGEMLNTMPPKQSKYLMSAITLGDTNPTDAQVIFDPKKSFKKYNQTQRFMSNTLYNQGRNLKPEQRNKVLTFMNTPDVQHDIKNQTLLSAVTKNYLPQSFQIKMNVQDIKPKHTVMDLSKAIKVNDRYKAKQILNNVIPKRSYKGQQKLLTSQYHSDLLNGVILDNELNYQGRNYFRQALRTYRYHPNLLNKLQHKPLSKPLTKSDKHAQNYLDDVAQNVTIAADGKTKVPNGDPLDSKQKALVTNYLQNTPTPVISNNLVPQYVWHSKKKKRQQKLEKKQALQQKLQKAEKSNVLPKQRAITMDWYHKLSQPGKQYLRSQVTMAGQDPKDYYKAMKTYRHYIPSRLSYKFKQLKQLETGNVYRFGKPFHIPQVPEKEKSSINRFMTDKRNRLLLLSGTLANPMRKYDKKYSPENYNQMIKENAPKLSDAERTKIRELFLNIKPRTRRYFTRLATYAAKDPIGTRHILYTHSIPDSQLDSTQQYKRHHLQQMETGKNADGDSVGTPLPQPEVKLIHRYFFSPEYQPFWANGTFKREADQLNNGDHSIDKDVYKTMNGPRYLTPHESYHQFSKIDKLYDMADGPNKMYLTQAVQQYALNPTSFKRNFVAHLTKNPKQLQALSVSERNSWKRLQGVAKGMSADVSGNLVATGAPGNKGMKARIDYFLVDPKNQALLKSGLMNKALHSHKMINKQAQMHPHMLINLGVKLFHLDQDTLGKDKGQNMLQKLQNPSTKKLSKPNQKRNTQKKEHSGYHQIRNYLS